MRSCCPERRCVDEERRRDRAAAFDPWLADEWQHRNALRRSVERIAFSDLPVLVSDGVPEQSVVPSELDDEAHIGGVRALQQRRAVPSSVHSQRDPGLGGQRCAQAIEPLHHGGQRRHRRTNDHRGATRHRCKRQSRRRLPSWGGRCCGRDSAGWGQAGQPPWEPNRGSTVVSRST